jgi:hypothetical protein
VEGYNYLSGSYDSPQELLVTVTDNGYYVGNQFVPRVQNRNENS